MFGSLLLAASQFSLMTFNIWGDYFGNPPAERDLQEAAIVARARPDIVALQEVTPNFWASRLFPELEKAGYAVVRPDEPEAIRRAGGRGDEGFVNHVPLLYRADRFVCEASGYDIFHLKLTNNKGLTWAVLREKESGRRLIAFSTHFWHEWDGLESDTIRELDARLCLERIDRIKALYGDLPVVGGGDLNALVGSEPHAVFNRAGYLNAQEIAAQADAISTWHGDPVRDASGVYRGFLRREENTHATSLDHVFVEADQIRVLRHQVVSDQQALDVSDHSPVIATFALR